MRGRTHEDKRSETKPAGDGSEKESPPVQTRGSRSVERKGSGFREDDESQACVHCKPGFAIVVVSAAAQGKGPPH